MYLFSILLSPLLKSGQYTLQNEKLAALEIEPGSRQQQKTSLSSSTHNNFTKKSEPSSKSKARPTNHPNFQMTFSVLSLEVKRFLFHEIKVNFFWRKVQKGALSSSCFCNGTTNDLCHPHYHKCCCCCCNATQKEEGLTNFLALLTRNSLGKFNKGDFHDSMKSFTYVSVCAPHHNKGQKRSKYYYLHLGQFAPIFDIFSSDSSCCS